MATVKRQISCYCCSLNVPADKHHLDMHMPLKKEPKSFKQVGSCDESKGATKLKRVTYKGTFLTNAIVTTASSFSYINNRFGHINLYFDDAIV